MDHEELVEIGVGAPEQEELSPWHRVRDGLFGTTGEQTWKRACMASSVLLLGVTVVLLIVLGVFIYSPNPNITTPVHHSTEYQAVVFPEDWDSSEKRVSMLEAYLELVNQAMGMLHRSHHPSLRPASGQA